MNPRWPLLLLRASLAVVFGYFGYQALVNPAAELAFISPAMEARSPLPLEAIVLIVGLAEVAASLAFLLGVWLGAAGAGAALLLLGVISSIGWWNEIGLRDTVVLAASLVVATAEHRLALQPTIRGTRTSRLTVFIALLAGTYALLLVGLRRAPLPW